MTNTAVITPFGLFEYPRMPFNLRYAAQSFQLFMDQIFCGLGLLFVYIQDVLIGSLNHEKPKRQLREVFEHLEQYGITVNPKKCTFGQIKIDFLGRHLDTHGISPLSEKTQSIIDHPIPESVKNPRRFLGMVNYYGKFIPNYAQILQPLTDLFKGNPKHFTVTPEAESAFTAAKQQLSKAIISNHLDTSSATLIVLKTDASGVAVGAVLQQIVNRQIRSLPFFTGKLTPTETSQMLSTYFGRTPIHQIHRPKTANLY